MRKAMPAVAAVAVAAVAVMLAGCGAGGSSAGAGGSTSPSGGVSTQQATATSGGGAGGGSSTAAGSGPAASTGAGGSCRPQAFLSFCEKIDITGAVTVHGTGSAVPQFDQGPAAMTQKCATWPTYQPQHPDGHDLVLPDDPVDGHRVLMLWPFPAGVGTSDIAKYAGSNSIVVDGAGFLDVAADAHNPTASSGSLRVNADGSGSLSFKDLSGRSGTISGTITWTCVDAK